MSTRNKSAKKHILVLASTFPASDNDPVPTFVKEQIIALKKIDPELTISVLSPHDARSQTASFTQHSTFTEYRFHYMWPHRFEKLAGRGILPQLKKNPLYYLLIPCLFIGELIATKRLIRQLKPDYLYAHWFTPQGVVAGMASKNIPFVITTHASDVAVWHKIPFGGFIVRSYSKKATAITAVSRRTLQKLQNFFSDEQWQAVADKTRIIPMGVDTASNHPVSKQAGKHIVFIGRLAEKKGVHYLLPAFSKVLKAHPTAQLTIAGNGPMDDELKKQAKDLGVLTKVAFAGWVDAKQKSTLLSKADIYVVPSIITKSGDAEGLPVSLMEGLAAGKLCIATRESGADDIITDEKDGYLVSQKDTNGLAQAITKALELDSAKRHTIQKQAEATAQQFSWDTIAKKHSEFLFKRDRL